MEVKPDISLRGLQKAVDSWITTTGVRYFSPLTNTAILAEETGEVARIMARKHGDQSFKQGESADLLADELADLLTRYLGVRVTHRQIITRDCREMTIQEP